jgi:hypothetical protein
MHVDPGLSRIVFCTNYVHASNHSRKGFGVSVMVFNAFNNRLAISWWLVLLVEKNEVPIVNHRPVTSH